ncbi:MAG: N-methyl-L-tryptophan oxidase [Acidobacteria bacterium]|nr:MAG: N-methyl-L-tryptophan oxidase [Acidobacteriota bacterium]
MDFDAIVLGLGAMGSASVFQLAKKRRRVLGIDQFSPPHQLGSSHGETRIIRQAIGEGAEYVPLVLRSYELWREIEASTGKQILAITGGLIMSSTRSKVPLHGSDGFLDQTIRSAEQFGIDHSFLDAGQIQSRFPQFNLAGDEQGYYEPAMGFLRPERCIESQLALAERHGAEIHRNEKVLEFLPAAHGVTVKTSAGQYTAEKLVVTACSWILQFIGENLAPFFKIYRQVLYWFEAKDSIDAYLPGKFPIFIWQLGRHHDDFIYGFPAIDGPHGGIKVASEQHMLDTSPEQVDREVKEEEITEIYRKYIRHRLPGLSSKCLKAAVCLYTSTPDSRFVIDFHPQDSNVLIVSPCSGHGFKHSAAIGEVVAELITVGRSRLDISKFRISRFSGN